MEKIAFAENAAAYKARVEKILRERTSVKIPNESPDHAAILYETFFEQANKKVRIFCHNLSKDVFGREPVIKAAQDALGRGVSIQVLTQDAPIESDFHSLRVSKINKGSLLIKRAPLKHQMRRQNFATMDETVLRFEPDRATPKAFARYSTRRTKNLANVFDNYYQIPYENRGASADKKDVHVAVRKEKPGLYANTFCKVLPDYLTKDEDYCCLIHADGAGTKSVAAYLSWRETGNTSVFRGLAQDSLVMNLDDLLCVGATGPFILSNTIGRNAKLIPGEAITEIIAGYRDCIKSLAKFGIEIHTGGGETADLGDAVRTLVVDSTLMTRMKRDQVITGKKLRPGLVLVGLSSFGKSLYESQENSGIGSNGLTSVRHEMLSSYYHDNYPEAFAPEISELAYTGHFRMKDPLPGSRLTVGEAILSPTRTYAPVLIKVFADARDSIAAVFHNTGGGLTKCLRFGKRLTYVKDNLFDPPPLFRVLKEQSRLGLRELYRSLNMGQRLEIACESSAVEQIISVSKSFGIEGKVIGRIEPGPPENRLLLTVEGQTLEYKLGN